MLRIGAADCLATIRARHVHVADTMAAALSDPPASATHLVGVAHSRDLLTHAGFESPDWSSLLFGQRPPRPHQRDPCVPGHGWQFFAAQSMEVRFKEVVVWPRLSPTEQALMHSQSGPMAGLPFSCIPSSNLFIFTPEVFRVLLLRRLWLPLSPCLSQLLVWPSTRRPWPPPRSLLESRSPGQSGIVFGVCWRSGLS